MDGDGWSSVRIKIKNAKYLENFHDKFQSDDTNNLPKRNTL